MKEKDMDLGALLRAKLADDTFKQDLKKSATQSRLEQEMMNQQGAAMNAAILSGAITGTGAHRHAAVNNQALGLGQNHIYASPMQKPETPFDPNNIPAYQASLEALCDLWRAKHGDKWVERRATFFYEDDDDNFWDGAIDRLGSAGLMESVRGWVRLKG